jgi:hypothetical protein
MAKTLVAVFVRQNLETLDPSVDVFNGNAHAGQFAVKRFSSGVSG